MKKKGLFWLIMLVGLITRFSGECLGYFENPEMTRKGEWSVYVCMMVSLKDWKQCLLSSSIGIRRGLGNSVDIGYKLHPRTFFIGNIPLVIADILLCFDTRIHLIDGNKKELKGIFARLNLMCYQCYIAFSKDTDEAEFYGGLGLGGSGEYTGIDWGGFAGAKSLNDRWILEATYPRDWTVGFSYPAIFKVGYISNL